MTVIGDLVGRLVDLGVDAREAANIIAAAIEHGQSKPTARKKKAEATAARATRLPPDWQPTAEDIQFGVDLGIPRFKVDRQIGNFRDFWSGVPGQKGCKADWPATWRNRMRQVAEHIGAVPVASASQQCASDPRSFTSDQWAQIMRRYEMTSNWNPAFGPVPGSPGFLGPKQRALL